VARARHDNQTAVRELRAAAEHEERTEKHIMMPGPIAPARELLGELLLDLGEPQAALEAFLHSQRSEPNRLRSLYGAARAAELADDREQARAYYSKVLQQAPTAAQRADMAHARPF
jgi:tetratricopeptide (TPR) repeat protein